MKRSGLSMCLLLIAAAVMAGSVRAQTTEFTYQGSLQNSSAPANGNFDFEFLLFDAASGGTQFGSTLTRRPLVCAASRVLTTNPVTQGAAITPASGRRRRPGGGPAGARMGCPASERAGQGRCRRVAESEWP